MRSIASSILRPIALATALVFFAACERDETPSCGGDDPAVTRPSHWSEESHCRGASPDYARVFGDESVHRYDISIDPDRFAAMKGDLDDLVWSSELPPDLDALKSPIWVPVDVRYDGRLWTSVGMRWKGHSSLIGAWKAPIQKLSFLLDFDRFEEVYPEIGDQRFFGFSRLVFANGYTDQSFIREKVAADIFAEASVPVFDTAFAAVYLDVGDGPVYLGLYTAMEDPADEMLERVFGRHEDAHGHSGVGNLYKPWGDAARWRDPDEEVEIPFEVEVEGDAGVTATGTIPADGDWWERDIEDHFEKCTNAESSDWSDVAEAIERLHAPRNEPEKWRADLEEVFDVASFLDALAVSAAIVNWDSYGCMHHNYYLYANPFDGGRLVWMPWDLGETMKLRQDETCPNLEGATFDEIVSPQNGSGVDTYWPLISEILADPLYRAEYLSRLEAALEGPFAKERVFGLIDKYHGLVAPYVVGPTAVEKEHREGGYWYTTCDPMDCSAFEASASELKAFVEARHEAVAQVLP